VWSHQIHSSDSLDSSHHCVQQEGGCEVACSAVRNLTLYRAEWDSLIMLIVTFKFTFTHHTCCNIHITHHTQCNIHIHSSYSFTFTHHTHCTIHIHSSYSLHHAHSQGAVGGIISAESMAATNAWVQGYIDTCGADPMAIATAVSVVIRDFIDSA
jgi:hypothetical protein